MSEPPGTPGTPGPLTDRTPLADRTPPTDRTPFVGRATELDWLDWALERSGMDGPAVVDITGEAGIGKSRLLAEFGGRARGRGVTVLFGRATEYERHSPYRPFADAFADLEPQALCGFGELAQLAPVLSGAAKWPPRVPEGRDRFGLHRTMTQALCHLGGERLVVILEDLHWADPASLELLDHLVRHPVSSPVLLVVSRRDRQAPTALAASLTRGVDTGAVLRLPLGPLDEQACVDELAGDLPSAWAADIYAASEGNPLYFLALLQAHRAARLPRTVPPASRDVLGGVSGGIPAVLGALLLDELSPLSPLERRTVEAAAVLGDRATADLLGALTGALVSDIRSTLDALMSRDLIRISPGGRGLTLRHPVIRTLVHNSIEPWRREEYHRLAATELTRIGAPVADRAHHLDQSVTGWDPAAAEVLTEAAERTATTAPAASAHWLGAVLRILPNTPEHLARRRELMLARARALGVSGGLKESRDLLHQLIDMPGTEGDDTVRISAVALCSLMQRNLDEYREAEALLRRELARQPGPSRAQRVELGLELGTAAVFASRYGEVRAELAETLKAARSLGDEIGEASALSLAAMGEAYEGDMAASRKFARLAARLVDGLTDSDVARLCESLVRLGWTEAFLENFADTERHAERGLAVARRTGQLYMTSQLLLCKAYAHFITCRITTARELVEEAESVARAVGSSELLGFTLALKSVILAQAYPQGDPRPLAVAENAASVAGNSHTWWGNAYKSLLAYAALSSGDPHRARDVMLEAGGKDLHRLQRSMRPNHLELLVTTSLATGDTADAERWAELAHEEASRLGLAAKRAAGLRSLAQIAQRRGDVAAAARMYAEAARENRRSGTTLREVQSLLFGAPLMAAVGEHARARAMWRRGRRLAADGGAGLLLGVADRVRPKVFAAAGVPPDVPDPLSGLTSREREIAHLVAEGLTSKEVGMKLHLSPRTVEGYLGRIYRKTGVPSRAALASLVVGRSRS
ncbi:helix-turn-helix transcriptional regulator [Streptomyces sp. CA-288835]|uniref:helix-turn-helix transcriptional regulator n=1 Tax=Streptomyces sp. CA-288835 TaxID=3240069 RepID=UPI003D91A57D